VATAALIVSVSSFLVALVAAWFARRSANAAHRTAEVDEARHHTARTPVFRARYSRKQWGDPRPEPVPVVLFDYIEGPPLESVRVELIVRRPWDLPPLLNVSDDYGEPEGVVVDRLYPFELRPGRQEMLRVARNPAVDRGEAVFEFRCVSVDGERWEVPVRCEVPPEPAEPSVDFIE
jgi:hypothetical protein